MNDTTVSLWRARDEMSSGERYDHWDDRRDEYDDVVVGAGITGAITALLLACAGRSVAIIEARDVGAVTTGNTTGKVSVLQGTRLSQIARRHPHSLVQSYVDGNLAAQRWLAEFCARHSVPVETADAYTYARTLDSAPQVDDEYEQCRRTGIPAIRVSETPLPYPVAAAVRVPDQMHMDPMPLLRKAIDVFRDHGGDVFVGRRVRTVRSGPRESTVRTDAGDVRARHVVLATGLPILDRGGFFARATPQRSYALAFSLPDPPPDGMYLSAGEPTRSIRSAPHDGERLLLVGGNGHVVGRTSPTSTALDDLRAWTDRHFPGARQRFAWSAQDYSTVDLLPHIGPILPGTDRIFVATGYGKWGMTNAVAAAQLLAARITDTRDVELESWSAAFSAWGPEQFRGAVSFLSANAAVALHLARGWFEAETTPDSEEPPAEGEGRIARRNGRPAGVCTVNGRTHRVGAVCPHLGGVLRWNDAESSWDCPLHGSRFTAEGALLEGPATASLTRLDD